MICLMLWYVKMNSSHITLWISVHTLPGAIVPLLSCCCPGSGQLQWSVRRKTCAKMVKIHAKIKIYVKIKIIWNTKLRKNAWKTGSSTAARGIWCVKTCELAMRKRPERATWILDSELDPSRIYEAFNGVACPCKCSAADVLQPRRHRRRESYVAWCTLRNSMKFAMSSTNFHNDRDTLKVLGAFQLGIKSMSNYVESTLTSPFQLLVTYSGHSIQPLGQCCTCAMPGPLPKASMVLSNLKLWKVTLPALSSLNPLHQRHRDW